MRLSGKWILGLLLSLYSVVALAQGPAKTIVTDTLFNPDGTLVKGSIVISSPSTFTSADGYVVPAGNVASVNIVSGVFAVSLVPNIGTNPGSTFYNVTYTMAKGGTVREVWVVPGTPSSVNLLSVRANPPPSPAIMLAMSQVNPPPNCVNKLPEWTVNGWTCITASGTGTVTSVDMTVPNWLAITGNPIANSGTLALDSANGLAANQVLATPNGTTGKLSSRSLVLADIPLTISGTLSKVASVGFTNPASNKCVEADASGNLQVAAAACGTGSGSAPGGIDGNVQYRSNSTTLGGISHSTTDGTITQWDVGANFLLRDPSSTTKKFQFDASAITAGQTRVVKVPDVATSQTVQNGSSDGQIPIWNSSTSTFVPGDPLVQGLFADASTSAANPVVTGGYDTAGTPAIHRTVMLNGNPAGTEYGIVTRPIPSGTQTVAGTVTANAGTGTFNIQSNASVNVNQWGGSATSLGQKAMTASVPVTLASDQSNIGVTGTVTANIGTTNGLALDATLTGGSLKAQGNVASGASDSGNPLKIGGTFNTTQPTVTTGQRVDAQMTARGGQIVAVGVDGFTVTANAGTNLNTSALALDTSVNGLLLSQGSTTSGQKGPLVQGSVTTAAPTYTTGQTSPLNLDTGGNLRVNCANCGGGSGGTAMGDAAAFTQGTTSFTPIGGEFNSSFTTLTSGQAGAAAMTSDRALYTNLHKVGGTAITLGQKTAANSFPVILASDQGLLNTQGSTTSGQSGVLMEGAVTTNAPSYTTAQTSPLSLTTAGGLRITDAAIELAQGSTTSGQTGPLIQGAVTTSAPTYTTGQTSPFSLDTGGNLRVVNNVGDTVGSGVSLTAINNTASVTLAGLFGAAVLFSSASSPLFTVTPELSFDNSTTWTATYFYNPATGAASATLVNPGNGQYSIIGSNGASAARVRISSFTSGSITATLRASVVASPVVNIALLGGNVIGSTLPVSGTVTAVQTTGTNLHMVCDSGCTAGGSFSDNGAFTFGTTAVGNMGAVVDDVATNSVTENSAGAPRMSGSRVLYGNLRDASGNEIASATSQPAGTERGLIIREAQKGQATMANSRPVVLASDQSAISVTDQQTNITADYDTGGGTQTLTMFGLALPASGGAVAAPGDSTNGLKVQVTTMPTTTVTGTVAATQSGNWTSRIVGNVGGILDAVGQNAASPANELLTGCQFNTTPTTITSGNISPVQCDSGGKVLVNTGTVTVTGTVAATESGTWNVRTQDTGGNNFTSNSTTFTAKFAQDINLLGTLGTAFSTAGKVDIKGADGDVFVRQATAANLNAQVVGNVASAASDSGNPIKVGGIFNTTQPTVTTGQRVDIQTTNRGEVLIAKGVSGFAIDNTGFNVNNTPTVVQGNAGSNAQAWWTRIGDATNGPVAVKAASTAAAATDLALVVAISPNNTVAVTQSGSWSLTANQSVNMAQVGGTNTVSGGVAGSLGVGGLAASGATKAGNPVQMGGVFNTTQPTVTTGQAVEQQMTARGAEIVATGVDAFNITCVSGCSGSSFADQAAFTFGTSTISNMGAVVDDTSTSTVAENSAGVPRMSSNRVLYGNLRDNTGNEVVTRNVAPNASDLGLVVRDPLLVQLINTWGQVSPKNSSRILGTFNRPINSTDDSLNVYVRGQSLVDPCNGDKLNIPISTSANVVLKAGGSQRMKVCFWFLSATTAGTFSFIEGTGSTCGTGTKAVVGGTTATVPVGATGGAAPGSGVSTIASTAVPGNDLCLVISGTGAVGGNLEIASLQQ